MSIAGDVSISWEDLPLKYGEDQREWNDLMARYSHTGCPGYQYEDNCAAPWDCASKGRCRVTYQKWQDIANKPEQSEERAWMAREYKHAGEDFE